MVPIIGPVLCGTFFLTLCQTMMVSGTAIENCPMEPLKAIITRTQILGPTDAVFQMQLIRKVTEDLFGGRWGVFIVKDFALVSSSVHWTFPDHKHSDGSPAFCLHAIESNGWQYNVFKTGDQDTPGRVTVEDVVRRLNNNNERGGGSSVVDSQIRRRQRQQKLENENENGEEEDKEDVRLPVINII